MFNFMEFAMGCCCDDCSTGGWGSNVGVAVGQRSWTVDVSALCGLVFLEEKSESSAIGSVAGLYCDVIGNAIVVYVWGIVFQNGKRTVLRGCHWWIGCKRWMFEGTVGSCDVVGIQDELHVGGGGNIVCTGACHPW